MKHTLKISYSVTEFVTIDVEDYALTSAEIDAIVDQKIDAIVEGDGWDYEWVSTEPKSIEMSPKPPADFWYTVDGFTFATNGFLLVLQGCPVYPPSVHPWLKLNTEAVQKVVKMLVAEFLSMKNHPGSFKKKDVQPFLDLSKTTIVGVNRQDPGYVISKGELIAIVMPMASDIGEDLIRPSDFSNASEDFAIVDSPIQS